MRQHDEFIEAREELVVNLRRDPTSEEIENEMTDREAAGIDAAYESARVDNIMAKRQEAKNKMGVPERIPK